MTLKFLETDSGLIYDTIMEELADGVGEPLYAGDERRIFGEALAMILMTAYNDLNDAAKQKALKYASGEVLDALGERVGVERIAPTPATATFTFTLSAAQAEDVIVPAGTRITEDGIVHWATTEELSITAGTLSGDVIGECEKAGEAYNGIAAGSINVLVDLIPYVSTVSNTTVTENGDDGEAYDEDGDERLRERIRLANAAFSVAGPEEAYKYFVLSSDPSIIDAYCTSPSACQVDIYPLMEGGELPTEEELQAVEDALSDDVRPMTDLVTAKSPTQVTYDINIKYYVTVENEDAAVTYVETDGGAIDDYISWQCEELGRDISPDALRQRVMANTEQLGVLVERMDVTAPVFTAVDKIAVAKWSGTLTVEHEVI